ncbi:MAG: BamA/TamA family outer membrane protein [Fibrobacterota bacterium]|nr:BamA/TamA family outer membrane protein [Fibrobacterota bacterium]
MKLVFFPMRPARSVAFIAWFTAVAAAGIRVEVVGNVFFKARQIKEVLAADPESYNKDGILSWQEDAQFYTSDLYRRNGFFDAKVDVDIRPKEDGGKEDWDAKLTVNEGERYLFDSVRVVEVADTAEVDNNKDTPPQEAPQTALVVDSADLEAKAGEPYQEEVIFQDRRFLLQRYGNSGYVRIKVDDKVTVKSGTHTVKVDYLVEPSYPVLFDTLIIRNQRAAPADTLVGITRDKLLQSLVVYDKGDTVRISDNDRLIEKLQYTGAYNFARLKDSLLPGSEHGSALILQLEERIPGNFRTSVFYETYSGFGISADVRHSNFAGTLNEVRGGGSLATLRQNLYAGYGSPLTFGFLIRFDNDFSINYYQDQPIHHSGTDSAEGLFGGDFRTVNSTRLTWPWSYWLRLVGNAEVESKSRMLGVGSRERSLNLNFIQTAYFAFLNQALDPSRGIRFAPTWGNGGPLIEDRKFRFTEFRHNWLELQTGYYYYLPSMKQVKLAARLDGGQFFGRGRTNSDRFFLGGSRSVRSYGFRELCPEWEAVPLPPGASPDAIPEFVCSTKDQTLAYFLTSYEARLAPFSFGRFGPKNPLRHVVPLEFVPFLDFGKVWDTEDGFSLSRDEDPTQPNDGQGVAMGLGFRYPLLGIFNFRLDFAWGRPGGGRLFDAWVIDLAQAF